ncbi:MAG TPA: hypothetical protein VFN53_06505 [Acidobacteriaceae bacterium]|nr:hypothetical protein [Acidobacteriaceae bacterium]
MLHGFNYLWYSYTMQPDDPQDENNHLSFRAPSLTPGPELMWRYVLGDPHARAAIDGWDATRFLQIMRKEAK